MNQLTFTTEEDFEHYLIEIGQKRYCKEIEDAKSKKYYSNAGPGRYAIQTWVAWFCDELVKTNKKALNKSIGRVNIVKAAKQINDILEILSPMITSVIAFKTILDHYSSKKEMTAAKVANVIGSRIEDELRFGYYYGKFNEKDQQTIKRWVKRPNADPRNRRKAAKVISQKIADSNNIMRWSDWNSKTRAQVGLYILEVAANLNLVELKNIYKDKKNTKMVYADELIQILEHWNDKLHRGSFMNYPLLFEPKQWQVLDSPSRHNNSGGYHLDELRRKLFMARTYDSDSWFGEKAVALLNRLQAVAWKVDTRVLDVAQHFQQNRINLGSLIVEPFDKPAKGGCPEHILENTEAMKEWKQAKQEKHEIYLSYSKRAVRTKQSLKLADTYRLKTFYLSWSLDYRSRYYTQQAWLQPQATDLEKSLLMFRDGCKVEPGSDALRTCKQAIGAAYKGSKISYQEREQWTNDNQELIIQIAENPLSCAALIEDANEPWQFLQLCLEWNDHVIKKVKPFWKVPIGADATASGLQLLSGMRRDPKGMKFANLLTPESPTSPPMDAYMEVLRIAREVAARDAPHLVKYLHWRSMGKPALMISLYDGSFKTIRGDIVQALKDEGVKIHWDKECYSVYETVENIHYNDTKTLTQIILKCSKQVFREAYEALEWLKKLFKLAVNKDCRNVKWSVPTGDLIHVAIHQVDAEPIYTEHLGKVMIAKGNGRGGIAGKGAIDKSAVVAASIPGFVHSFDAALCKEAFSTWNHPLSLTHDCFKCLPSHLELAMDRVRDGFMSVVSDDPNTGLDPLSKLADDLNITSEELPRLKLGEGKLEEISRSIYMFN